MRAARAALLPGAVALLLGVLGGCAPANRTILQSKGSDTVVNLMARMSEAYARRHPEVVVAVNGGGSGTGIKSLIDGTTDIANASRSMKPPERTLAQARGVEPVEHVFAYDGLAIYLHASNPIPSLSFAQLACIYGEAGGCDRWSDLGVTLDCGGDDRIIKLNRQNNSGTYEYFKEVVLGKAGRFTETLDQSGTQQVTDVIGTTPCAIGYGGMGYGGASGASDGPVRYACLQKGAEDACVTPSIDEVRAGRYPFARPLYLYTNGAPTGAVERFLSFIISAEGQEVVLAAGFVPLPAGERHLGRPAGANAGGAQ